MNEDSFCTKVFKVLVQLFCECVTDNKLVYLVSKL